MTMVVTVRAQFSGNWSTLTTMPTALAQTATAVDSQSRLWVIGGWGTGGTVSNGIEIYDSIAHTWSTGPTLPTAVRDATALYYSNQIFVFGGYTGGSQSEAVQVYNLGTSSWSTTTFSSGGWAMNGTVLNSQLYAFAGETLSNAANRFDPTTSTFTSLTSLPFNSIGGQSGAIGNLIYLAAGSYSGYTAGTQFAAFNPATNTWNSSLAQLPAARTQFAAASNGQFFFVAGGGSDATNDSSPIYSSVYAYNPATDTWLNGPSLSVGVREASGVMLGSQFLVIGGYDSTGSFSNEIYALQTVPEPSTAVLLALGLGMFAAWRRGAHRRSSALG